jgi:tRNA pseudouridine55 synthase
VGRRPKWGRPLNGVLLLNKSGGMTSNTALQKAKRLFNAKRAGHTGSLDPLATGVLPLCFGEATKFSQYLLDSDKCYLSTFRLGVDTETGDCDGEVVSERSTEHITRETIEKALVEFRGSIQQVPSIYSALKYQGKPFYKWAREGLTLPDEARQPRNVTVYRYETLDFRDSEENGNAYPEVDVLVKCSKGTYIRTLAQDLGQRLGCGAHVIRLHRQAVGDLKDSDASSLDELEQARGDSEPEVLDQYLLSMDTPLMKVPELQITDTMGDYFCQGQAVMSTEAYRIAKEGGIVRVYLENGQFLGVARLEDGKIAPKRVVNY